MPGVVSLALALLFLGVFATTQDPPVGASSAPRSTAEANVDPAPRLAQAQALLREAETAPAERAAELRAQARGHLLWCFDRPPSSDRAFAATRLGLVADLLGSLAGVDPQTRTELIRRRDQRAASVLRGGLDNNAVAELLALNEVLDQGPQSIDVYVRALAVHGRDPLTFFYDSLRPELWRARGYQLILAGRPDARPRIAAASAALREAQKRLLGGKLKPAPGFTAGVVTDIGIDFEARLGTSQYDAAKELAVALLEFAPGELTLARLVAHAERAERAEFGKEFAAEQLARVADADVVGFWKVVAAERAGFAKSAGQ